MNPVKNSKTPRAYGDVLSLLDLPPEGEREIGKTARLVRREWEELAEIAKFETTVREVAEVDGKISTNDILRHAVQLLLKSYWEDNGGPPRDDKHALELAAKAVDRRQKASDAPTSKNKR